MILIKTFLQTIWISILTLGWPKVVVAVILIALISRAQRLLGLLAALLFIAYLLHWI